VPYALEGWVRRELVTSQAVLLSVAHGRAVHLCFELASAQADALVQRLGDSGQGKLVWLDRDNPSHD